MTRRKIVAGNWKMNMDAQTAVSLAQSIDERSADFGAEVVLFPPFVLIDKVKETLGVGPVKTGAQNCSEHESGAYTGEVSAGMLASLGVEYVLIGHSERREYFKETDEQLQAKLSLALKHGLKPVFCCGEPLAVRQQNSQQEYVQRQLEDSLFFVSNEQMLHCIIAYEPIWAIGTGLNATPEQVQEMHAHIRLLISNRYPGSLAQQVPLLYGGSCKPDNAKSLFDCPDVDGGLIGGASLKASDFLQIIDVV